MTTEGPSWGQAQLEELFDGQTVLATDATADPVPAPDFLRTDDVLAARTWTQRAEGICAADRPAMVRCWWDAVSHPGEVRRTRVRVEREGVWLEQEILALNLLDLPLVGAVLVGFTTVGECAPPPVTMATEDLLGPDGTRVGRPVWLLQELSPLGVVERTDGDVEQIFGRSAEELQGMQILDLIHPDDQVPSLEMWASVLMDPGTMHTLRERIVRPDGSVCWIEASVVNRLGDAQHGSVLSICHDVTERRAAERVLHTRATVDDLTGLLNRRAVVDELRSLLSVGRATAGFVDLDNFKSVNDHHGHPVGDAILTAVAKRLMNAVPDWATVGRWGGDEFLVVAPGDAVVDLVRAVDELLADPIEVDGLVWWPSASLGVVAGDQDDDVEDLIRDADRRMYATKMVRQRSLEG